MQGYVALPALVIAIAVTAQLADTSFGRGTTVFI